MLHRSLFLAAFLCIPEALVAQQVPQVTAADYARAEGLLRTYTAPLVFGATVNPTWLGGDRMWYRNAISDGSEFVLVDASAPARRRAFDHARMAGALSAVADTTYYPFELPFTRFDDSAGRLAASFERGARSYSCDVESYQCDGAQRTDRNVVNSPDGTRGAFVRDYNLWVRDLATGAETQLTTDGIEDFGYATDNAGWVKRDRPVVLWSPDSRKIATFQHDGPFTRSLTTWISRSRR